MKKLTLVSLLGIMPMACGPVTGPPVITVEARASFWKAAADYNALAPNFEKARLSLEAARASMAAQCGDKYQLAIDKNGDAICEKKPEPVKEPAKK